MLNEKQKQFNARTLILCHLKPSYVRLKSTRSIAAETYNIVIVIILTVPCRSSVHHVEPAHTHLSLFALFRMNISSKCLKIN